MECSCEIESEEGDVAILFREKMVTARKDHHCCECKSLIACGTRHSKASGIWDDEFAEYRTCADCKSLETLMVQRVFGSLYEDIREYIFSDGEIPEACIAELTKEAREFVCGVIEMMWNRYEEGEDGL